MSIFGLGPIEIGVILVVALMVFGILRGILRATSDRGGRT
jgi:Sec-independent protein translocase protein TatA